VTVSGLGATIGAGGGVGLSIGAGGGDWHAEVVSESASITDTRLPATPNRLHLFTVKCIID
jgi:hypothetical protein